MKLPAFHHATLGPTGKQSASTTHGIAGLAEPLGEIRVFDETGENMIEVITVQGQRAFGV